MLLTNVQLDILIDILENKNIIFSAPTSYGKSSIVINALFIKLKENDIQNVVFVLPSKALINEYRKNLNKLMAEFKYQIEINESPYLELQRDIQYIHLFTQERVLIFDQINKTKIDYVVFDEIQDLLNIGKMNSSARAVILAKAVSIFENKQVPMIFLMPYIQNPESEFLNLFTSVHYSVKKNLLSPTTSNKYLIVKENNQYSLLDVSLNKGYSHNYYKQTLNIENIHHGNNFYDIKYDLYKIYDCLNILEEKNINFCNKSHISGIADKFCKDKGEIVLSDRLKALIKYLENYVHPNFELITFLKKGIGIHHADLDTFTKRQIEECFRDKKCKLNFIFCTSTLLQGVNLNANNLFFLAQKGQFNNTELDKKNLFGRVGRIRSKLQGNIYRFWVEGNKAKLENQALELNASNEEYKVGNRLILNKSNIQKNDYLQSYFLDNKIKQKLTTKEQLDLEEMEIDNFDYFLGKKRAKLVEEKIQDLSAKQKEELENKLKFSNIEECKYVIEMLSEIYNWQNSEDFDEKYRMTSTEYIATIFYNQYVGLSIKQSIDSILRKHYDLNSPYVIVILKKQFSKEQQEYYPKLIYKENRPNNFVRIYQESDINLLIYSYIYEIQNIIEFRVKKYLQDLYYRLLKSNGKKIQSVEDFLIYSTVQNKRKINLNKIGLVDSFAINELVQLDVLFHKDEPNLEQIKKYAERLSNDSPLKYAILDIVI